MSDPGYVYIVGPCVVCGAVFSFNPHRVPSVRLHEDDPSSREPICSTCIVRVNAMRVDHGLPPWPVYDDSYEAIPANELAE